MLMYSLDFYSLARLFALRGINETVLQYIKLCGNSDSNCVFNAPNILFDASLNCRKIKA